MGIFGQWHHTCDNIRSITSVQASHPFAHVLIWQMAVRTYLLAPTGLHAVGWSPDGVRGQAHCSLQPWTMWLLSLTEAAQEKIHVYTGLSLKGTVHTSSRKWCSIRSDPQQVYKRDKWVILCLVIAEQWRYDLFSWLDLCFITVFDSGLWFGYHVLELPLCWLPIRRRLCVLLICLNRGTNRTGKSLASGLLSSPTW